MGVATPETTIVESSVPRSGIAWSPVRLKRWEAPEVPVNIRMGTLKLPLVAVVTVRTRSMFVPHTSAGAVLIWYGVLLVLMPLAGRFGYVEKGWVMVTPAWPLESVALTPLT